VDDFVGFGLFVENLYGLFITLVFIKGFWLNKKEKN
jgi:hypothetical protein